MYAAALDRRRSPADRAAYLLIALVLFFTTRISPVQIGLGLIALLWAIRLPARRRLGEALRPPPFLLPLLLLILADLLAGLLSLAPLRSLGGTAGLTDLLVVVLFCDLLRGEEDVRPLFDSLFLMGAMIALVGITQYLAGEERGVGHRISGPMDHYMTYSGILMIVGVLLVARLALPGRSPGAGGPAAEDPPGAESRGWLWAALGLVVTALVMTYSRHAWVGFLAGIAVVALFLRSWKLVLLPLCLVLGLALSPGSIADRLHGIFDTRTDLSNVDRINLIKSGLQMVADHPLTGVGPGLVAETYPAYRTRRAVKPQNSHLHNTPLQVAAESGLLGLVLWLWFVFRLFGGLIGRIRELGLSAGGPREAAAPADPRLFFQLGPLAAAAAFFVAGLFEYNFGDTEIVILFLFTITAAHVAGAGEEAAAAGRQGRSVPAAGSPVPWAARVPGCDG